jgi:DNA-binding transcriptional ArsR family regulator
MRVNKDRAKEPNRLLPRAGIPRPKPADCIKAIGTPQRRRILRALHEAGEARSPNELAGGFKVSVGHVSYHVKVLKECRAVVLTDTQQKRGAVEHFYASAIEDDATLIMLLADTKAEDEKGARRRKSL